MQRATSNPSAKSITTLLVTIGAGVLFIAAVVLLYRVSGTPTVGALDAALTPPMNRPPDALVLFDGQDLDAWMDWGPGSESSSRDALAETSAQDSAPEKPRWKNEHRAMLGGDVGRGLLTRRAFGGYLLHMNFMIPEPQGEETGGAAGVYLDGTYEVRLGPGGTARDQASGSGTVFPIPGAVEATGQWQSLEIAFEDPADAQDGAAILSAWLNGRRVLDEVRIPRSSRIADDERTPSSAALYTTDLPIDLGVANVTVLARFRADGDGTIFSKAPAQGVWKPNAKAVFFRGDQLIYDIGWIGALNAGDGYNDGQWHTLAYVYRDRVIHIYVDGDLKATKEGFISDDDPEHVFKIGAASPNFAGDLDGNVSRVLVFERALDEKEIAAFAGGDDLSTGATLDWRGQANRSTPELPFASVGKAGPIGLQANGSGVRFANIWVSPLTEVDHAELIGSLSAEALTRGQKLYNQVCIACHGSVAQEGTLPTARQFHAQALESGNDPFSMYKTLDRGYKQMLPQVWMNPQQKYDVIHYIRESIVRESNSEQYFEVTPDYLAQLPRGRSSVTAVTRAEGKPDDSYTRMNFGPSLNWTFEVAPDNIAYKGIAIRIDETEDEVEGGISRGTSWVLYDHDTMRVAAMWEGDFIDWRGIAFDGSHQTHTKIAGEPVFVNPVGPGWARPGTDDFDDPRIRGRDGKPYGPLPRDWSHFEGIYKHGNQVVVSYSVGTTDVLERPFLAADGVMVRTIEISDPLESLTLRVAPDDVSVALSAGTGYEIQARDGFTLVHVPAASGAKTFQIFVGDVEGETLRAVRDAALAPTELQPLMQGGPPRWPDVLAVRGALDVGREWEGAPEEGAPYVVDSLFVPRDNPWNAWMRLGGFDFYPDGKRAAVCTWNGDVWLVSGIDDSLELLTWQRIASGLFQPLGVKIVDDTIYVTCRDQIVRLHDLNGDGEIDFFENFNSDHQVTEHFHEFAMGLETDADGDFYYAKGARHAKTAIVPQHGTLLRVAKDGSRTEIVANGFRAPNGFCVNDDGTFFVTDQEGHWTPKNRINWVQEGEFYGNFMGYHDKTNSDSDMQQPLVWLTNEFDRSPADLLWATTDRWGPLQNQLIAVSYGMGQVFAVPHETVSGQMQGGQTPLPLPLFPTGIMRGRFSDRDGQLYVCGLFAWAGNRVEPGGFYRVRYTGGDVLVPVGIHAGTDTIELTLSAELDAEFVQRLENYEIKAWDLKRSGDYGSQHYNERTLPVTQAILLPDGRTVRLTVPDLVPTWGMKCVFTVRSVSGEQVSSEIHNTIHAISQNDARSSEFSREVAGEPQDAFESDDSTPTTR